MRSTESVRIIYYRFAGKWLFFRVKQRCAECDATHALLHRLMSDTFRDKPVTLQVRPWLNDWWRILWRGAWHAPIVMLNGRVFSQGRIPNTTQLIRATGELLGDRDLLNHTAQSAAARQGRGEECVVYSSPTCSHCRNLREFLRTNGVSYAERDVTNDPAAAEELRTLTGHRQVPVVVVRGQVAVGFDESEIHTLLGLDARDRKARITPSAQPPPRIPSEQLRRTRLAAQEVLRENQFGTRTRASRRLYPHQWNWDAGFIARGYLHFEPERAYAELRSLFKGQWSDGFLPHIVFNSAYLTDFPGPDYWKAWYSPFAPVGIHTSGIGQPPIHASMMVDAAALDPDKARAFRFLEEIFPKLEALHAFYFRHRDPYGEHLVCLVHPWESGADNTPLWDEPLSRVDGTSPWAAEMQRNYDMLAHKGRKPTRDYIEKYSYLVERLYKNAYDWPRIMETHPFRVQDVLFNSVLCRAEADLARVAEAIGRDPEPHRTRSKRVAAAIRDKLWDSEAGTFYSYDLAAGQLIRRNAIFSYMPLYAGACDAPHAEWLVEHLLSNCFCLVARDCVAVPSYDMCQAEYDDTSYWRGPVWVNVNWCLANGLRQYGWNELASWIEHSLLRLVAQNGFYEYYEPTTGRGLGAEGFSWTAALFLDLASRMDNGERAGREIQDAEASRAKGTGRPAAHLRA